MATTMLPIFFTANRFLFIRKVEPAWSKLTGVYPLAGFFLCNTVQYLRAYATRYKASGPLYSLFTVLNRVSVGHELVQGKIDRAELCYRAY